MSKTDQKQAATNNETRKHIAIVGAYISFVVGILQQRAANHDKTKLEDPELPLFTEYTEKLAGCTYGSDEYKEFLEGLKPALIHHYSMNRHHPEHFLNGIDDMNLIDVMEMICDWKAATLRHNDGNILKSIDINTKRFNIDPQLAKILKNTVELFEHNDVQNLNL